MFTYSVMIVWSVNEGLGSRWRQVWRKDGQGLPCLGFCWTGCGKKSENTQRHVLTSVVHHCKDSVGPRKTKSFNFPFILKLHRKSPLSVSHWTQTWNVVLVNIFKFHYLMFRRYDHRKTHDSCHWKGIFTNKKQDFVSIGSDSGVND